MSNQRNTVQRQIVLDALRSNKAHPANEEIYAQIHREHPSISRTTVYRNLRLLAASEIIRKVLLQDGLDRYDDRADQHYHFKCKKCGNIIDVDVKRLTDIDKEVQKKYGFRVEGHDILFSGICTECKG